MRKKLIIGNWKMHGVIPEASILIERLKKEMPPKAKAEIVICPSFVDLYSANHSVVGTNIKLGAQNIFWEDEGAFTGEISPAMLNGLCEYAIVGHSERRFHLKETDKEIAKKAAAAIRHGIVPVICVGDTLQDFNEGYSKTTVLHQLQAAVHELTKEEIPKIVIAYEPVWAIGTGKSCNVDKASDMAKAIRHTIAEMFGKSVSNSIRVIYGGSVDDKNAHEYLENEQIDGVLVGGASLDHLAFSKIIKEA
jgi:triosephosphate isomerase (TIM)